MFTAGSQTTSEGNEGQTENFTVTFVNEEGLHTEDAEEYDPEFKALMSKVKKIHNMCPYCQQIFANRIKLRHHQVTEHSKSHFCGM